MLKPFFEPVEPEEHDKCVDGDRIAQHRHEEEHDLLICTEFIDVNGIKAALGACAAGKEKGVDVCHAVRLWR